MEKDFVKRSILVDYSKSIEEAVAAGHYRFVETEINSKNFKPHLEKIGKKEELAFKLFKGADTKEILADMEKEGFHPGEIMELAALGFKYPRLQRECSIVALCPNNDGQSVPCLRTRGSDRGIALVPFNNNWKSHWNTFVFLGIQN